MDCVEARRLIDPLLDGSIGAGEQKSLLEHIETCPACRAELSALRQADEIMRVHYSRIASVGSDPVLRARTTALRGRVASAVKATQDARWRPRWHLRWRPVLVALAALVLAFTWVAGPGTDRPADAPGNPVATSPPPGKVDGSKPGEVSGSKRLDTGTLAEAEEKLGFKIPVPTYLPSGTAGPEVAWGDNSAHLSYTADASTGKQHIQIAVTRLQSSGDSQSPGEKGSDKVVVSGVEMSLITTNPEPGDTVSRTSHSLTWVSSQFRYRVYGDIGLQELMKVAGSLVTAAGR